MKPLPALIMLCALAGACTTDSYDAGDNDLSFLRADFADAYTDGKAMIVSAMTDDGDSLVFSQPTTCDWATTKDSVYRALVYYNKVDQRVEPTVFSPVPVMNIARRSAIKKPLADDPLKLESAWRSANGRYINLGIAVKTGYVDDDKLKQSVALVCDTIVERSDGSREYHLRLYHGQNDIPQYYSANLYLSIPMAHKGLAMRKGDDILLTVNTYDGYLTRRFAF